MRRNILFSILLLSFSLVPIINKATKTEASATCVIENRAGCCSHHGGVCGCNHKRHKQKCCDGTFSPSCRC